MTRLLVLAPAPESAASTRFRLQQFFPALRARGIEPVLRPFLDEDAFAILYSRGHAREKFAGALRAIAGRLYDLVRAADAILIHREAALVGPPILEWLFRLRRPIVFDLDDAVWVPYASPTYGALLSRLFKAPQKTHFTLRAAARVLAGNQFIADYARRFNAAVDVIPTVVDSDQFRPAPRQNAVPVLGWVGTHSSLQYLRAIVPALQRVRRKFQLRVIGARLDGIECENRAWSLAREVEDFQSIDVGLYPLVEDPWSLGKSGFKAIQYMACGAPVVASPVGVTRELIREGVNGFLASSDQQWVDRLERLIDDAALRKKLGEAGRAEVEARWSAKVHAPRFADAVESVVRG